jgi:DNA-binding IscR family transcriptional regulator
MARTLQILSQRGHLKSIQGINGGYSMNPSLQNLSLFELQKIIDGESAIVSCLKIEGQCEQINNCTILQPVQKLEGLLKGFLQDILVIDLLTPQKRQKNKATKGKLAWAR